MEKTKGEGGDWIFDLTLLSSSAIFVSDPVVNRLFGVVTCRSAEKMNGRDISDAVVVVIWPVCWWCEGKEISPVVV
jgi:hypothetical protein